MRSIKIRRYRTLAAQRQQYRCWYCCFPIWTSNPANFAKRHGISLRQAARFQCTAEHLLARQDGGRDEVKNLVAACLHCNRTRHKRLRPPDPDTFRIQIQAAIRRGRWHPAWAHTALRSNLTESDLPQMNVTQSQRTCGRAALRLKLHSREWGTIEHGRECQEACN